jgi:hypothetical protein
MHAEFKLFVPPAGEAFELVDLEAEVTLLDRQSPEGAEEAVQASRLAGRWCRRSTQSLELPPTLALNGEAAVSPDMHA